MEIKGNIGEEVYIKAVIKKVVIDKNCTRYFLEVNKGGAYLERTESEIIFKGEPKTAVKELPEKPPEIKRGPGRPKKATVDDLVKKSEDIVKRGKASNER